MRLTFVLARRFMRGTSVFRTTWTVFAVALCMIGAFVTLQAFTLSGAQVAERDLGRFDNGTELGAVTTANPGDDGLARDVSAAVGRTQSRDFATVLASVDVRLSEVDAPRTPYLEAAWQKNLFPDRYVLTDGVWPMHPGEVVVTHADAVHTTVGSDLSVLAGHYHFRVVGTAEDRYTSVPTLLASTGTWATLSPALHNIFPTLDGSVSVYWNGPSTGVVTDTISKVLTQRLRTSPSAIAGAVAAQTTSRQGVVDRGQTSWIARLPTAYAVPSLTLPVLAMLLAFGLNLRRHRRNLAALMAVGVRPRQAVVSLSVAITSWALLTVAAGVVVGLGIGAAIRPAVQHLIDQPLSPLPALGPAVLILVVTCLLGAAAGGILLQAALRTKSRQSISTAQGRPFPVRTARYLMAAGAVVGAVVQIPRMGSLVDAMVFAATLAAAVLLLAPDLTTALLTRLPARGPRMRLGCRQLLSEHHRTILAVIVLAAALGLPLGFLTLVGTASQAQQASLAPDVAPGQVVLCGRGGYLQPPSSTVVHTLEGGPLAKHRPIQIHYLGSAEQNVSVQESEVGFVLAVDTSGEIAALIGRDLSTTETTTLNHDGLIIWKGTGEAGTRLISWTSNRPPMATEALPTTSTTFPVVGWQQGTRGVLLTSTAHHLNLPISDGARFYTDVTRQTADAAQHAVLNAGLDPKQVLIYQTPHRVAQPTAVIIAALGLLLLALLTSLSATRSHVSTLGGYINSLIALGLPSRWTRQVLLIEQTATLAIGTLLAVIIAIPPVIITSWQLPGFTPEIPWTWLTLTLIVLLIANFITTLITHHNLRTRSPAPSNSRYLIRPE